MGWLDTLGLSGSKQNNKEEEIKKKLLLRDCTLDDLYAIAKAYISKKPKFVYKDSNGLEKHREPTRAELVSAIITNVSLEGIIKTLPELENKLKRLEE